MESSGLVDALIRREDRQVQRYSRVLQRTQVPGGSVQMAAEALTAVAKFFGDAFGTTGLRTPMPVPAVCLTVCATSPRPGVPMCSRARPWLQVLLAQLAKYHARCPPLPPLLRCTPVGPFCEGTLLKRADVLKDWRSRHVRLQSGQLTWPP
jgi:hypothetical protein